MSFGGYFSHHQKNIHTPQFSVNKKRENEIRVGHNFCAEQQGQEGHFFRSGICSFSH